MSMNGQVTTGMLDRYLSYCHWGVRSMNRSYFLRLTLAAMATTLLANSAAARGVKVKNSGGSSSSSSAGSASGSKSGGGTTVVPVPRSNSGKEDCTTIADPARRHDCAAKQIGR
jgi:hypothetical protein